MPTPSLATTLRDTGVGIGNLERYRFDSKVLDPRYQHFIAELITLRLFSILEGAIADIAYKLVAGAAYLNGNQPIRLTTANSMASARTAMLNYGRAKPRQNLRWTKAKDIRDSTSNVLPATESFITYARAHGHILDEMRKVRNYIAHRNADSRKGYRQVVRAIYGANSKVNSGAFLASDRRRSVAKVDEYLTNAKVIISDLAKG